MPDQHAEMPGKSVIYSSTVTQHLGAVHCTTVKSIQHPKCTVIAMPISNELRRPTLKYTKRYYSPRMAKSKIKCLNYREEFCFQEMQAEFLFQQD
jgi:hypothetical protein